MPRAGTRRGKAPLFAIACEPRFIVAYIVHHVSLRVFMEAANGA